MLDLARRGSVLALGVAALAVAAATAGLLPGTAGSLAGPAVGQVVHLVSAFVGGLTVLRLPRAAPREPLDLLVSATALGLAAASLLTLAAAALGVVHPAVPWIVDALLLVAGAARVRGAAERLVDAWRHLDLSVVVASRVPVHALAGILALPYLVSPFVPTGPGAATEWAVVHQCLLRHDLAAALDALGGSWASPAVGLLLHGGLGAGAAGAGLHLLTLVILLAAASFLHAHRHVGPRAAAWVPACLLSAPLLLDLETNAPSGLFIVTIGFLAFHEIADWCAKATGGKIALASVYGGLALAEGPRGAALFASLLGFLFVVQAFVDRHGIVRQVPGVVGMACIALMTALPFLGLGGLLASEPALEAVAARHAPDAGSELPGLTATATDVGPAVAELGRGVLLLGPLVVSLLVLLPLAADAPEGLRHAVLAAVFGLACWALPSPWATPLAAVAPAAVAAGTVAGAVLHGRRLVASVGLVVILATAPTALLHLVTAGPDVFGGAAVAIGRRSWEEHLREHAPDHELVALVSERRAEWEQPLALVGDLSVAAYRLPIVTPPSGDAAAVVAWMRLGPGAPATVAVDSLTAPPPVLELLASWPVVLTCGPEGRHRVHVRSPTGSESGRRSPKPDVDLAEETSGAP